jgi:hypothetical protein
MLACQYEYSAIFWENSGLWVIFGYYGAQNSPGSLNPPRSFGGWTHHGAFVQHSTHWYHGLELIGAEVTG